MTTPARHAWRKRVRLSRGDWVSFVLAVTALALGVIALLAGAAFVVFIYYGSTVEI